MTKRVIILNGPPSSGKDDGAKHLSETYMNTHHREFKAQLIKLTKTVWGVDDATWEYLYTRERKEIKTPILGGMSPREALIHTSEVVIKPNYGKQYFGKFAAKTLGDGVNVFSDGGFVDELKPIVDEIGDANVMVVRLHRPGYTFSGDSRNYLPDGTVKTMIDLQNDGTFDEFLFKLRQVYCEWAMKKF